MLVPRPQLLPLRPSSLSSACSSCYYLLLLASISLLTASCGISSNLLTLTDTGSLHMHHMTPCVSPAALLGYWSEVWTLCEALWGRLEPADQDPDVDTPGEYKQQLERRRTFSAWLSCGATSRVEEEVALAGKGRHVEAIFSYLSGNRISDACRLAQREGETTQ